MEETLAPRAPGSFSRRTESLLSILLLVAVVVVYLPVWQATYIWDDAAHLTENPVIVGPQGLKEIWTTSAARICPLTLTTFWFGHSLWGLHPLPYHLLNVLLHAASALLLRRVLRRLGAAPPVAWLGTALWALHPVNVETVTWITELKNVQSGFFFLLCILFFLHWLDHEKTDAPSRKWSLYGWSVFFGALAMASKSSTVILPIVLGLCAWWKDGRWQWRRTIPLIPWMLLALAAAALSVWTQRLEGAHNPAWAHSFSDRIIVAGKVIWFYPAKLLWPHPLMLIYPRWNIDARQIISWIPVTTAVVVFLFLWWKRQTRWRPVFFAAIYFLAALLPVLGLVDHTFLTFTFVGDHFQYLASMGALTLLAAGIIWLLDRARVRGDWQRGIICGALLALLSTVSWSHARVFRDPETLWRDTALKNPDAEIACVNMGSILLRKGDQPGAIVYFERTLQIKPDSLAARNNLAWIFVTSSDPALRNAPHALELVMGANEADREKNVSLLRTLAAVYAELGRFDDAITTAQKTIALAHTQNKDAIAIQTQGDLDRYKSGQTLSPLSEAMPSR